MTSASIERGVVERVRVRFSILRARCDSHRYPNLYVWLAVPHFSPPLQPQSYVTITYGRRSTEIPAGSAIAATWAEAMAYATTGTPPTRLDELPEYREWCGG